LFPIMSNLIGGGFIFMMIFLVYGKLFENICSTI